MFTRHCVFWLLMLGLAASLWAAFPVTRNVSAQEAKEAEVKKVEAAPAAAAGGDEGSAQPVTRSRFMWFIQSSGLIGLFILCLSIYFVATVVRLFMEVRKNELLPADEVSICQDFVRERNYQGLYDFTSKSFSLYSRLVTAGLTALNGADLAEAREVMDRHGEVATVDLDKQISPLAVLGTLGPMIGLVGTLKGMIASFAVIAMSDTQMRASEVAGGISEALLLTFEGVALSVPAIYFFSFFRNRAAVFTAETLLAADEMVRRIIQQSKTKTAPPLPAAARA